MACFFAFHDDGMMLAVFDPQEPAEIAGDIVPAEDAGEQAIMVAQALPAPAVSPSASADGTTLFSSELAARAVAAQEEPERPGLFLATLGDTFSRLSFLKDGEEPKSAVTLRGLFLPDSLEADSGLPEVYAENERYTVETGEDGLRVYRSSVAKGDTAGVILNEWLSAADVATLLSATNPVYSLTNIHEGRPFCVVRTADTGDFVSFIYEIDKMQRVVVHKTGDSFTAVKEAIEYDTQLVKVDGTIRSSLFEAVTDCGEGAALAVNLAEVFSCEVNFINELRQGDNFEVLVEKLYREGEFKGYGNMLAARFTNQGRTYEAFLFAGADGRLRHYNANGEALQKTLLKAPLAFTRVSSGYSMNRRHPVFGYSRPHQGVDYAAPMGTPIKAVGDGVITKAGWGNGYGNMIIIKHSGGLESQYAHMSGFASGMKSGVRVRQGQVIGYVGATGVATGPHLDFRLRQNGKFIDPGKAIVPRADPVEKARMAAFRQSVSLALSYMNGETALAEYKPGVPGK